MSATWKASKVTGKKKIPPECALGTHLQKSSTIEHLSLVSVWSAVSENNALNPAERSRKPCSQASRRRAKFWCATMCPWATCTLSGGKPRRLVILSIVRFASLHTYQKYEIKKKRTHDIRGTQMQVKKIFLADLKSRTFDDTPALSVYQSGKVYGGDSIAIHGSRKRLDDFVEGVNLNENSMISWRLTSELGSQWQLLTSSLKTTAQ